MANKITTKQRLDCFLTWLKAVKDEPTKTSMHASKSYGK